MNIYTPFTYIIGWSQNKKFYYGAKYARGCHPNDLWTTYFTSSKYVKEFIRENGEPDIIKIHRTFEDKDSCITFEHYYLHKIDAKNNTLFLNESNGGLNGCDNANKIPAKDYSGKTYHVFINDPRFLSGELEHVMKNKIAVKDKDDNCFSVEKDDPRFLSGELVGVRKGKITVKDKDGNYFSVEKDDPRYLSGELVGNRNGNITVKDKDGNYFSVEKDDPRYLSGELLPIATESVTVKDSNGNTFRIDKGDPRYLSGELVGVTKGTITVKDSNGNKFRIDKEDPRFLSGELVGVTKNIKCSNERRTKLSKSLKGHKKSSTEKMKGPKTNEHRKKLTEINSTSIWVLDIEINEFKRIPREEFDKYKNIKYISGNTKFAREFSKKEINPP